MIVAVEIAPTVRSRRPRLLVIAVLLTLLAFTAAGLPLARAAAGSSSLVAGEYLDPGQSIVSPDGRFQAVLQGDGNFVVYGPGGAVQFSANTYGTAGARLYMQGDGNLVLYGSGGARWFTGTSGSSAHLEMQSDGNLVVYAGGRAGWSSRTGLIPVPITGPSQLAAGEELRPGQALVSPDGQYQLILQGDGNLVLYGPGNPSGRVVFSSGTFGTSGARLVMQGDGNLVLYGASGARWFTGTSGSSAFAAVQNDGQVVVYAGGRAAWSSRSGLIPLPPVPVTGPAQLSTGGELRPGQALVSPNGQYYAILQGDGNFVLYGPGNPGGRVQFSTGTGGTADARLVMQGDGNLVLYGTTGARWSSGTKGSSPYLTLLDEGKLVVVAGGRYSWTSQAGVVPFPAFGGTGTYTVNSDIGPGTYFVNYQIGPGTFRTRHGAPNGCVWDRLRDFSGQLSGNIGSGSSHHYDVVTIDRHDAGFRTYGCDAWSTDLSAVTASPVAPFGDGTNIIGVDQAPGIWSPSGGSKCYWVRLSGFSGEHSDILMNGFDATPVTIEPTDVGFSSEGCGTWTKVG